MDTIEIAKTSYREVLDATKHQDDKVGRVITAAAFLTTGALTLITHNFASSARLVLPDARLPVVAIGVGIFFACTAFAVVALLLSLSTPHVYLSGLRPYQSLLFFHEIGRQSEQSWNGLWSKDSAALEQILQQNYIAESLNLARRVKLKYKRTNVAVSVFQLGIFYLYVGVIAFLFGFVQSRTSAGRPIPIDPNYIVRVVFLVGVASYLTLQVKAIIDQAKYERRDWSDWKHDAPNDLYIRRTTARLALGSLLCMLWLEIALVLSPMSYTHWIVLFVLLGPAFCLVALRRPRDQRCHTLAGQCTEINGGVWRSWQRRDLYLLVALGVGAVTIGLGLAVSLVATAMIRVAIAAAIPLLIMVVGVIQRVLRSPRPGLPRSGTPQAGSGGSGSGRSDTEVPVARLVGDAAEEAPGPVGRPAPGSVVSQNTQARMTGG